MLYRVGPSAGSCGFVIYILIYYYGQTILDEGWGLNLKVQIHSRVLKHNLFIFLKKKKKRKGRGRRRRRRRERLGEERK